MGIGFAISAFFLYLLYLNITKQQSPSSKASDITNNRYMAPIQRTPSHSVSPNKLAPNLSKRDDLYFTNKAMLNRVSSSTYNVEPKYDYNSSPTKIQSLHPQKIATHQNLNDFLRKQREKENVNKSR